MVLFTFKYWLFVPAVLVTFLNIYSFNTQNNPTKNTLLLSYFIYEEQYHREIKYFAWYHTANKWQRWNS